MGWILDVAEPSRSPALPAPDLAVLSPGSARNRLPASDGRRSGFDFDFSSACTWREAATVALVHVGLVVLLDVLELVAVVAHESVGLAQALRRDIPLPVDALQAGAVAQVEAGHGIDGMAVGGLGVEEIVRGEPQQQRASSGSAAAVSIQAGSSSTRKPLALGRR